MKFEKNLRQNVKEVFNPREHIGIFLNCYAVCASTILIVTYLRKNNSSETWDRGIFFTCLLTTFLFFAYSKIKDKVHFNKVLTVPLIVGASLGVAGIEVHGSPQLSKLYWLGFGSFTLLTMFAITPIWPIVIRKYEERNFGYRTLVNLAALIIVVTVTLSFYQTSNSLIDPNSSLYNINEMLAMRSGKWPYSNFIPQYGGIWMYLSGLLPFIHSTPTLVNLGLFTMFLASLADMFLAVYIIRKLLPNHSWGIAIVVTVPLIAVTQFPERIGYFGSIAALLSALPVRILTGICTLFLYLRIHNRLISLAKIAKFELLIFGIVLGTDFWVSQDFGLGAILVVIAGLLFVPKYLKKSIQEVRLFSALGLALGILLYPTIALAFDHPIKLQYLFFFERQFGGGFGAESIKVPGPILIVLPLLLALFAYNVWKFLILWRMPFTDELKYEYQLVHTGLAFSAWGLFGFPYYLNRSWASGQLQILLFPLSISLSCLMIDFLRSKKMKNRKKDVSIFETKNLLSAFLLSISFAAIINLPNPSIEVRRIFNSPNQTWLTPEMRGTIDDVEKSINYAHQKHVALSYYGNFGNIVKSITGVNSVNLLNAATDYTMSNQTAFRTCQYLSSHQTDLLILSSESTNLVSQLGGKFCGIYESTTIPGIRTGHILKRVEG